MWADGPFMGGCIPAKEETEIKIPGMEEVTRVILGNDGGAYGEDFIEDVVPGNSNFRWL